ncbi:hypothetical transmembrane protein [Photorhabdus asymbiotica]|uniref:Uncharacterized protein n=2 Tax=Photorhabdus asymbiotica TaxID=291112 RepID=A0ABX9SH84_9GAMM|nr:hypothetical protein BDD30_4294 [Photorhabdus asymbiotica]CAQ82125.1 hypothetical transmembrane protein [Photorhabdus asymbiotica]
MLYYNIIVIRVYEQENNEKFSQTQKKASVLSMYKGLFQLLTYIPFILQVAALLAAFTHPSHIVIYAPGDSFTCRRAATRNLLGIKRLFHSH